MIQKRQMISNGNGRVNNFSTHYLLFKYSYNNFRKLIINRHNLQKFDNQGNEVYKSYGSKKNESNDQRKR